MKHAGNIWLFFALTALLPLSIYGVVSWYEEHQVGLPVLGGKENGREHRIGNFELYNQDGEKQTLENWKDKIVVANFFFTHCPVVCPKMTRNLKTVASAYAGDPEIVLASISVDPIRDSVPRLKIFAQRFSINSGQWSLLTGDKKHIYQLARHSFQVVTAEGDGGPDDFIHSEKLVLVDGQHRIRGYYSGTEEKDVKQLLNDIKKLKNED